MAMDEETKKRLQEISRAKRGILLKDLSTTDLMVACDHFEEFGKLPEDWTIVESKWKNDKATQMVVQHIRFNACYLKYAKPEQIATLEQRLPCRRILLPVTYRGEQQVVDLITDSEGITCRIVTDFPVAAIDHILKFLNVKQSQRYWRRLDCNLEYYDLAPNK